MIFCGCETDGYCKRYGRVMSGRFREICAGINVDLGTAAAFREQWRREVRACTTGAITSATPTPLLLKTDQAPGDAVVATSAIYSLHRAHPGKYLTAVESPHMEVFAHNPDVVPVESVPDALPLQMHYPAIHQSNHRGIHFMQGFCEHLSAALGVPVPLLTNRPRLFFKEASAPLVGDFWLVCSGGKRDFTNKLWGQDHYQAVIDELFGIQFVQIGSEADGGVHPRLRCVEDLVGQTTLRQVFELVRRARGVLCGVSLLMHVAAALEKPAIVVAGGREPVQWNAYPLQSCVSTVGWLPCRSSQGEVGGACWRSRTIPLGDGSALDKDTCEYPIDGIPKCMQLITPRHIAEMVLQIHNATRHGVVGKG